MPLPGTDFTIHQKSDMKQLTWLAVLTLFLMGFLDTLGTIGVAGGGQYAAERR